MRLFELASKDLLWVILGNQGRYDIYRLDGDEEFDRPITKIANKEDLKDVYPEKGDRIIVEGYIFVVVI